MQRIVYYVLRDVSQRKEESNFTIINNNMKVLQGNKHYNYHLHLQPNKKKSSIRH